VWNPADILTDLDLLAIDRQCLTEFGVYDLTDKRQVALQWVGQRVEQAGYRLDRHQVRKVADAVFGFTGTAFIDYTTAASDQTEADLPLSSVCAVPSSAAVYVGYRSPFRGAYVGVHDAVNARDVALTVSAWNGRWQPVNSLQDQTQAVLGKTLSGGGRVAWQPPDQWSRRSVNNSLCYWVRLTIDSSLTAGTAASQVTPVVTSRLTLPAAQYALGLLYQESYGSNRGQWQEKATALFTAAEQSLGIALPLIADEFDIDADEAVSGAEASSVTVAGAFATWERG